MDKIITCPYCHKEIKRGNGYHIKRCQDEYIRKLTDEEKERFYRLYVTEQRSLVELSKIFGIKYSNLQKILSKIGIPLRSLKEAANTPRRKELYEDTMMKHFGTKHNFDKNNPSRKKWEKRLLDEEGITNVFQRKEVIEKIHNTMIEKYGEEEWKYQRSKSSDVNYYIQKYGENKGISEWQRVCNEKGKPNRKEYYVEKYGEEKGCKRWIERLKQMAKAFVHNDGLNSKCAEILDKYKVKYTREFPLYTDKQRYIYDFKIDNVLIELNGIYWHCSPKKYKPNDLVKFPNNKFIIAKDKWASDNEKYDFAISQGYKIIVIWEDEISDKKIIEELNKVGYEISQN